LVLFYFESQYNYIQSCPFINDYTVHSQTQTFYYFLFIKNIERRDVNVALPRSQLPDQFMICSSIIIMVFSMFVVDI